MAAQLLLRLWLACALTRHVHFSPVICMHGICCALMRCFCTNMRKHSMDMCSLCSVVS